jgi:hypothetical protein
MTVNDWKDELYEANEQQWFVDRKKFNAEQIIQEYENSFEEKKQLFYLFGFLIFSEGPYVCLKNSNDFDGTTDPVNDKTFI